MKTLLNKNIFICDEKQKKEQLFYSIVSAILFIVAAVTFWEFIYELSHMVGSIVSKTPSEAAKLLCRMFPLQISAFIEIYMSAFVLAAYGASTKEKRIKTWRINGFITIILGMVVSAYVLIGVLNGQYNSFIEGYISPLFPLDVCIGGLLFMVFGYLSIRYATRIEKSGTSLYLNERLKKNNKRKAPISGGKIYAYMLCLCGFAGCFYGIFVMDFSHGNLFFNIMLWLNYFSSFAMFVAYRYVFLKIRDEYKAEASFKIGLLFLIINVILFSLYMLSVQLQNEAPNLNAFGVLPIEFAASMNAFAVLYGSFNIIAPVVAIISGIRNRQKK